MSGVKETARKDAKAVAVKQWQVAKKKNGAS